MGFEVCHSTPIRQSFQSHSFPLHFSTFRSLMEKNLIYTKLTKTSKKFL